MKSYFLRIPPEEILRPLRAEIEAAEGQPELYLGAREDFLIEEDFDRRAYGLDEHSDYDLVAIEATMTVEPRVERDYWVLSVSYHKDLGPKLTEDEDAFFGGELTLDEFEARFLAAGDGLVRVRLDVETPEARQQFAHWWADLNERHPRAAQSSAPRATPAP